MMNGADNYNAPLGTVDFSKLGSLAPGAHYNQPPSSSSGDEFGVRGGPVARLSPKDDRDQQMHRVSNTIDPERKSFSQAPAMKAASFIA